MVPVSLGFGPMQFLDFGPMQWARPSMCFICCMVCGSLGELTKLRAYGFQFWFQVLSFQKRSSERLQCTHHSQLAWECFTLIIRLCFELILGNYVMTYHTVFINMVLVMF